MVSIGRANGSIPPILLDDGGGPGRDLRVSCGFGPGATSRMASMSDDKRISRFPVPSLDELPADMRARIDSVAEKTGFVPNVFRVLAHRPDEWRAFFAYHDAVMEREGGLSPADRQLIVVATSAANDCFYCVVAHGAVARLRARDPLIADQVAVDWRKAD